MTDLKTLILVIEQRISIAERNNQAFVDLPYDTIGDVLALLKEHEAVSSEALKAHYGKMYKCKGCGLEWYQQTQRYCQHCGKAVRF